jgi:AraC family transcriptional regulator of adaptative response/methylated-DNA-[protein]-cysteine methyltransferase
MQTMIEPIPSAPVTAHASYAGDEARWQAVTGRDRGADGAFTIAVRTTGVYCRPGCPARTPKRQNVVFFADPAAARAAGFRACKRCRPDDATADAARLATIGRICRLIETAEEEPTLAELAASADLSPYHFHRMFVRAVGMTPKAYAKATRSAKLRSELSAGRGVTRAAFEAGYSSSSRAYADARTSLGMPLSRFRERARGERIRYAIAPTRLGDLMIAATDRGLCALEFGDSRAALQERAEARFGNARQLVADDAELRDVLAAIVAYVEHPQNGLRKLPLDVQGTAFQRSVWNALCAIPVGETRSYGEIAEAIGAPKAVRAVGTACGANPVALVIPCHRAVRSDGSLGGYFWGLSRKRDLLGAESAKLKA